MQLKVPFQIFLGKKLEILLLPDSNLRKRLVNLLGPFGK